MKPFFAKYIPVEGEIKPKDFYSQSYQEGQIGQANEGDYLDGAYKDKQKVKLFLCSRNIQVGDIIKWASPLEKSGYATSIPIPNESELRLAKSNMQEYRYFKVIGEISLSATWIKEGDKFAEDEMQHNHICYDSPGNMGCCFHCSRSKGCDSEDYNYLIKGPCGHFH